jgi:phytoene synthase
MIHTELHAAGISNERLRESYRYCRRLNAEHGRTYFLATRLLTPSQRPAVHALYGFARYADDILDDLDSAATATERQARLEELAARFVRGDEAAAAAEPVLPAVLHTARTYRIPLGLFDEFLAAMRMDLTITDYPDRPALNRYMRGSAEVIGLQMLPILGTVGPLSDAEPCAEALGRAFQLTNFLRDINEDLERNRVYLPADELAAFGVDRALLTWCHDNQRTDPRVRQALAAQHEITRAIYREAHKGIALLAPQSRPCVTAAFTLYSEILDRIEDLDFEVFSQRASVGMGRRLQVFTGGLVRARRARKSVAARRAA